MKTNPNDSVHNSEQAPQDGLKKREYFAAMAMQGLGAEFQTSESHSIDIAERLAIRAVNMADALINELNKEKP